MSYIDLSKAVPILAIWLADVPKDMLEVMDEVTRWCDWCVTSLLL